MWFSGFLIAIEGSDRLGKTMLWNLLAEELGAIKLRFPDRTSSIGELINKHLQNQDKIDSKVLHYLFAANRAEKEKEILNYLKAGKIVICDRYYLSGQIYTKNKNYKNFDFDDQEQLDSFSSFEENFIIKPDLCLIIYEKNIANIQTRKNFGNECFETIDFQTKINADFQAFAKKNSSTTLLIESSSDWTTIKPQIVEEICKRKKAKIMEKGWFEILKI